MSKIIITENSGRYTLASEDVADFALIGILECVLADLKSAARRHSASSEIQSTAVPPAKVSTADEPPKAVAPTAEREEQKAALSTTSTAASAAAASDLRTRIGNAVKAIRGLGGQIENIALEGMSDEQLHDELDALTEQYKRLKARSGK